MNTYALGFIVGLLLVINAAVVWFLLRRIAAQDRRLVELEALQDDWEPPEPDFMSAADAGWAAMSDEWTRVTRPDALQVWRASTVRHYAEQVAAEAEQEEAA